MANPRLPMNSVFPEIYAAANLDTRTGQPKKKSKDAPGLELLSNIRKQLRVVDEQDAVTGRYEWYGIPADITALDLERYLYYRGQLALVNVKELNKFVICPFTMAEAPDGSAPLDILGRPRYIRLVPPNINGEDKYHKGIYDALGPFKVVYTPLMSEPTEESFYGSAVIIRDYTPQAAISNSGIIPRQQLNDPIIDLEASIFPYIRTRLKNSTGTDAVRVNNQDEASNVYAANASIDDAAMNGDRMVPITGAIEFQELAGAASDARVEEFMMMYESLNNYRLSLLGLDNGGTFTRPHEYVNQAELMLNNKPINIPLINGLEERQNSCLIAYSIWGIKTWVMLKEERDQATLIGANFAPYSAGKEEMDNETDISSNAQDA